MAAGSWAQGRIGNDSSMGDGVSFWGDKNILELDRSGGWTTP